MFRKNLSHIAVILLLFVVHSCKHKTEHNDFVYADQHSIIQLKSERINLDEPPLFPKGCCVKDSLLILFEAKEKDGFLCLYSLKSLKKVAKYGAIGNGPCEFSSAKIFFNENLLPLNRAVLAGDNKHFYQLHIDSIFNGYDNCENAVLTYAYSELNPYNYVLHISDSLIIVNKTGDHQLTFYNPKTRQSSSKNYFSKIKGMDVSDFVYNTQIYDAHYSSSKDKIVVAYKYFKCLDIISKDGKLLKHIKFPDYKTNRSKIKRIDSHNIDIVDAVIYYTFVHSTNNYFYALCWNTTRENITKANVASEIHKFDWDGNLINIMKLDSPVSYFCIDEKANILYNIGMSSELDLEIYKCPLLNIE
jgi:hypothetical protein